MKTIIAGSRKYRNYYTTKKAIDLSGWSDSITEVVSGKEPKGPDHHGEEWARGGRIPVRPFPANWNEHGRAAGPLRNCEMGRYADRLIAVWDGISPGTKHMIGFMRKLGKPVFVYLPEMGEFERYNH